MHDPADSNSGRQRAVEDSFPNPVTRNTRNDFSSACFKREGQPMLGCVARSPKVSFAAARVLQQVFDGFAGALEYLRTSLYGAHSNVLAGVCGAFAQVGGRVDGVQRH